MADEVAQEPIRFDPPVKGLVARDEGFDPPFAGDGGEGQAWDPAVGAGEDVFDGPVLPAPGQPRATFAVRDEDKSSRSEAELATKAFASLAAILAAAGVSWCSRRRRGPQRHAKHN